VTVAVVTPWVNHPELVDAYMHAIDIGPRPDELIIVDNGSRPRLDFSHIRSETNLGFSAASNLGLHAATTDIVVFLNNDIEATEAGWLERLTDATEPGVLTGARLRDDPHTIVDGVRMPYLDGWCLAGMRDDLLELGGFDETLQEPAYYSDNILCLNARAAGMTLREVDTGLIHLCGATSDGDTAGRAAASAVNRCRYIDAVRAVLAPA
jgi:GT2 family glycosyltransferase